LAIIFIYQSSIIFIISHLKSVVPQLHDKRPWVHQSTSTKYTVPGKKYTVFPE